jgi:adenosylcobinamide-GDP ribazoletransferase
MPPHPLLIALQFLTRLPLSLSRAAEPREIGRSLIWYPAVGLLVGLPLTALARLPLPQPLLHAALLLALWVAATGALHLDGLADTADAWIGGAGDAGRTLRIMKDPAAGPAGVVAIVLVLLLKLAAIAALLEARQALALLLVPLLARAAVPALFLTTPYVRAGGLGSALSQHLPRAQAGAAVIASAIAVAALGGGAALLAGAAVFALMRRAFVQRLGGITGDTVGAVLECIEAAALVAMALASAEWG